MTANRQYLFSSAASLLRSPRQPVDPKVCRSFTRTRVIQMKIFPHQMQVSFCEHLFVAPDPVINPIVAPIALGHQLSD